MQHYTYTKINTLFKRDMATKDKVIMLNEFSDAIFEYLKDNIWVWTEKIDGTNVGLYWDGQNLEIHGKSKDAQIPKHLEEKILSFNLPEKLKEIFPQSEKINEENPVIIFGEGYGDKIQGKIGSAYVGSLKGNETNSDFIIIDVRIGKFWLQYQDLQEIAQKLNLKIVPIIKECSITQALEFVRAGFKSQAAIDKTLQAEGLVGKPKFDLRMRNGERIIVKLKTNDFKKAMLSNNDIKSIVIDTKQQAVNYYYCKSCGFKFINYDSGFVPCPCGKIAIDYGYDYKKTGVFRLVGDIQDLGEKHKE